MLGVTPLHGRETINNTRLEKMEQGNAVTVMKNMPVARLAQLCVTRFFIKKVMGFSVCEDPVYAQRLGNASWCQVWRSSRQLVEKATCCQVDSVNLQHFFTFLGSRLCLWHAPSFPSVRPTKMGRKKDWDNCPNFFKKWETGFKTWFGTPVNGEVTPAKNPVWCGHRFALLPENPVRCGTRFGYPQKNQSGTVTSGYPRSTPEPYPVTSPE
jgi:hypothetical protein